MVPARAIIPAGSRRIVLVDRSRERLEPRPVKTGLESDGMVEVWSGLAVGERVLVSGTFLAAAESRIRSSGKLWTEPKPKPRKRRTEPNRGGKPGPGQPGGPPVGAESTGAGAGAGNPPGPGVEPGSVETPPGSGETPPGSGEAPPAGDAPADRHPPGHRHPPGDRPSESKPDAPSAPATTPSDAQGGGR